MSNNDFENQEKDVLEEVDSQDTIVDEPWANQFEKEEPKTTRSARIHATKRSASLYTRIIFSAIIFAIVVVVAWALARGLNLVGGSSKQNSTTPSVPKLVLQSQTSSTTSASSKADESSSSAATSSSRSSESSSRAETSTTAASTSASSSSRSSNSSTTTYTIQSGDSIWTIANKFGMTTSEFKQLNGLTDSSLLLPGRTVQVRSN